ncbi:MAG: hypothetical protein CL928_02060 [Deltaproteobacteria bacterium]|nr:hypothetical protein [Deltaproteobacteria bacterium]
MAGLLLYVRLRELLEEPEEPSLVCVVVLRLRVFCVARVLPTAELLVPAVPDRWVALGDELPVRDWARLLEPPSRVGGGAAMRSPCEDPELRLVDCR